jgi:hypothetical protein
MMKKKKLLEKRDFGCLSELRLRKATGKLWIWQCALCFHFSLRSIKVSRDPVDCFVLEVELRHATGCKESPAKFLSAPLIILCLHRHAKAFHPKFINILRNFFARVVMKARRKSCKVYLKNTKNSEMQKASTWFLLKFFYFSSHLRKIELLWKAHVELWHIHHWLPCMKSPWKTK